MANGHNRNWIRVCVAIDGFRARYGRWPKRVRIMPISYADLVANVLSPIGFALVDSVVEMVCEEGAEMIAEDDSGATFCYGSEGSQACELDESTAQFFGEAILRPEPPWENEILGWDASGNPVTPAAKKHGKLDLKSIERESRE